jgi:hypothetical protein
VPAIPQLVADKIARELDIDVDDIGICHACLSFVSFALDEGDEREIRLWTNRITADLWDEGLALTDSAVVRGLSVYDACYVVLADALGRHSSRPTAISPVRPTAPS